MNATLSETESEREMAAKQRQERVTEEASARQERKNLSTQNNNLNGLLLF
jgi:hypothetical protein